MESTEFAAMRHHEDTYWWYRGIRELAATAVRRYSKGMNCALLDAGCGTGGQLSHLLGEDRIVRAVGLDFSMEAVRMAAQRGLGGLLRGSTTTLPSPTKRSTWSRRSMSSTSEGSTTEWRCRRCIES